jgi:hypothetical protein
MLQKSHSRRIILTQAEDPTPCPLGKIAQFRDAFALVGVDWQRASPSDVGCPTLEHLSGCVNLLNASAPESGAFPVDRRSADAVVRHYLSPSVSPLAPSSEQRRSVNAESVAD